MDNTNMQEISIQDILNVMLKRKLLILLCTLLCAVFGFLFSRYLITPMYTTQITLYVDPGDEQQITLSSEISSYNYAKQLVNTYIELLKTKSFYSDVEACSNGEFSASYVSSSISISSIESTELFKVTVTTDDPEKSYRLAVIIGDAAPDIITRIMGVDSIKIADPPTLPTAPSNENTARNVAIGALIGFALCTAVCILVELLDNRVKNEDELRERFNIPVLGGISNFQGRE